MVVDDQFGLPQEFAGNRSQPSAAKLPRDRLREEQPLFGPGHADEQQAALFLQFPEVFVPHRPLVRNQAVLDGEDVDDGKFESLGGVQRHQRHGTGRFLEAVDIAGQAGHFQESFQGGLVFQLAVVLAGGRSQLVDVGQPLLVLLRFAFSPTGRVSGSMDDGLEQPIDRTDSFLREVGQHPGEVLQFGDGPLRQFGNPVGLLGCFQQVDAFGVGPFGQPPLRRLTDAPQRAVDDPQEGPAVVRIVDQPQVGQHVFDLGPFVELDAGGDLVRNTMAGQRPFHLPGQRVDAVEQGEIGPAALARFDQPANFARDEVGLVLAVAEAQ